MSQGTGRAGERGLLMNLPLHLRKDRFEKCSGSDRGDETTSAQYAVS